MTVRILIDTNIWLELAKDYRMYPVLIAIEDLIKTSAIELIVPKIVADEFEKHRERVIEESKRSLASYFKRVRDAISRFGDEDKKYAIMNELSEIDHRVALKGEASKLSVHIVQKLIASNAGPEISDAVKLRAANRALEKQAPFHLSKNSMADAIIIETFVEAAANCADQDSEFIFVTGNVRDFSHYHGDQRLPHPDLTNVFDGMRTKYSTSIIEVIRAIDNEMLEEYQWEHTTTNETRRLSEILEAENLFFQQVWYSRHWSLRAKVENGEIKIISREEFSKLQGYHPEVIERGIWEGALAAAERAETELGADNIGPWSDFEWGMINGKLSALRWVLGDEWDMLDT